MVPEKMRGAPARSALNFRFRSWLDNLNGAVLLFILSIPLLRFCRNRLGGVVACEMEGGFALSPSANSLAFEERSLLESR